MLPLLLTLLTSAAEPPIAIVERSTLGVSTQAGAGLRGKLKLALGAAGLEAVVSAQGCQDRACLLAQAQARGGCVVGMTVVKNRKGLTIDLEAVKDDALVLQQTFLLTSEKLDTSPDAQVFAHDLKKRLERDRPLAEPPPAPQEQAPTLTPVVETRPEWLEPAPAPVAPVVLGGVSAGVGAAAIGLLIASAVVKGQLEAALQQRPVITTLTRDGARQQADLANALLGIGLAGLGVGVAGGATALGIGLAGR